MFKFKRRATKPLRKSNHKTCIDIDASGRTALDETSHDDAILRRASTSDESDDTYAASSSLPTIEDTATSLDECIHISNRFHHPDVLELVQKRLSHLHCGALADSADDVEDDDSTESPRTSRSSRGQVSFLDEELGLTPRHLITSVAYRPKTSALEKETLYYNNRDFDIFEQEELYERIENEIQVIESQKKTKGGDAKFIVTVKDDMKLRNLIRRVERRKI